MNQRPTELLPSGSSAPRQSPREDEHANPSRVNDPSMPDSFTRTDPESQISPPHRFIAVRNRSKVQVLVQSISASCHQLPRVNPFFWPSRADPGPDD
jgi:hypothetical protein